jgi:hypothetical protein
VRSSPTRGPVAVPSIVKDHDDIASLALDGRRWSAGGGAPSGDGLSALGSPRLG